MTKNANGTAERSRLVGGIVLVIVALVLFSGWMLRRGPVNVRAERVIRQQITNIISTNGKIEPVSNFEAHAVAPAMVKRVLVKEGDQIKPGQLLIQLDDADARAQAAKARAELRGAEADLHAAEAAAGAAWTGLGPGPGGKAAHSPWLTRT